MQYLYAHIEAVIHAYKGDIPLTHFLTGYTRTHARLGSRDRRILAGSVYAWYRCRKALPDDLPFKTALSYCLLLCSAPAAPATRLLPDTWKEWLTLPPATRISRLDVPVEPDNLLAFPPVFSEGTDRNSWLLSMFQQPLLFIRLRQPSSTILPVLQQQEIACTLISEKCLALPNGTPVEKLLPATAYVVQDASSQAVGDYFRPQPRTIWWDCCAGAGGKSLLLKDLEPSVKLIVSDIRGAILRNLSRRFALYGYPSPVSYVMDMADSSRIRATISDQFDGIICDVPCTGSGTWARTPEQLFFFREEKLADFVQRQQDIVQNAASALKPGGRLIYITCSVWKAENEDIVSVLAQRPEMRCTGQALMNGVETRADSMFVSVWERLS